MQDGNTPLHVASSQGNADCVKVLLGGGANPHTENEVPYTEYMYIAIPQEAET